MTLVLGTLAIDGWLSHLVQRERDWAGPHPAQPPPPARMAVPNVTAHPSTASVPITVLLYNCPLLCGFNVHIKGLKCAFSTRVFMGFGLLIFDFSS